MALNQKIRLQIISALDDAGIKATAEQLDKLQNKVVSAEAATQGLGREFKASFNPMEAVLQLAHGNVEGVTKSLVQLGLTMKNVTVTVGTMTGIFGGITIAVTLVKKLIEHFNGVEEAAKKAAEEEEKLFKAALDAGKSIEAAYKSASSAIDEWGKKRSSEITLTKNAERAELELAAARAKAAGDTKKYEELTAKAKDAEIEKTRLLGETEIDIARKKYEAAKKQALGLRQYDDKGNLVNNQDGGDFTFNARGWEKQRRLLNGRIGNLQRQIDEAKAGSIVQSSAGAFVAEKDTSELESQLKEAKSARIKLREDMIKAKTAAALVAEAKRNFDAEAKTKKVEAIKTETEIIVKTATDAEQERHTLAMKNLKAEADEKSRLEKGIIDAKSRFEREFSIYKSGNAAQQIEAEKQDEEARKRLAKDASRYGGKWRIDELAGLYANNDEEGVRAKLSEWRKSSRFTPEVEAMVRAAAADKTKTTAEEELRKISANTEGLATKLDELLAMKG